MKRSLFAETMVLTAIGWPVSYAIGKAQEHQVREIYEAAKSLGFRLAYFRNSHGMITEKMLARVRDVIAAGRLIKMFDRYQFNPHSVPVLIAAFAALTLGIILRLKRRDEEVSSHFLTLCGGIFVWLFCTAMGFLSIPGDLALKWFHFDNAGVMFISPSFYAFSMRLTKAKQKFSIFLGYGIAITFATLAIGAHFPAVNVSKYWWGYFPRWLLSAAFHFLHFLRFHACCVFPTPRCAKRKSKCQ